MVKKILKKTLLLLVVAMVSLGSLANCFGRFAVTHKFFSAHDGINIGSGFFNKFVKTLLLYFPFAILYGIGIFVDVVLFNLIEFWSGSNPVGLNEFDKEGKFAKTFLQDGTQITLTFTRFGSRLDLSVEKDGKFETLTALRNQPGKFFKSEGNKLVEVEVTSETVGSQVILKLVEQGKLKSSKVIEAKTLADLQSQVVEAL
ncbi:PF11810 domain protein [Leptospira inadai serovar Lyme str. 10]|uniref:PF11810 domain protein n=2 Tax=Leptospira inadai serovar Lyme TaxID=293084 RepID=V6HP79_9LEPT|nr:DUF3332 family protein [Leptospira inadai]EQA38680.1 PF11810 domain protein [Leptospira inadai serovar Lyme str. 10]PNV75191.1 DUF3332 domain-containing protein [Leptospira inadai serovar Lyme]